MTLQEPEVLERRHYTEAEAASFLGVDRHTVGHWRRSGLMQPAKTAPKVLYTGAEIRRIWMRR